MDFSFDVFIKIQKPVSEVFDALYNPQKLEKYFTTKMASAPMDEGRTVFWDFADFPTEDGKGFPVKVLSSVKNQKIVFEWEANDSDQSKYNTTVTFTFESLDPNNTKVMVNETGWRETQTGLKASFGNCMGWSQMIAAMKAYLEYGINLRKGAY